MPNKLSEFFSLLEGEVETHPINMKFRASKKQPRNFTPSQKSLDIIQLIKVSLATALLMSEIYLALAFGI